MGRIELTCAFAASCDFDRRMRTSKSHNASNSHVIWLFRERVIGYGELRGNAVWSAAPQVDSRHLSVTSSEQETRERYGLLPGDVSDMAAGESPCGSWVNILPEPVVRLTSSTQLYMSQISASLPPMVRLGGPEVALFQLSQTNQPRVC